MMNQIISSFISFTITLSMTACTIASQEEILQPDTSIEIVNPNDEVNSGENIVKNIEIIVNDNVFTAEVYDNETAKSFVSMLPITVNMKDLNDNEKFYYLSDNLITDTFYPEQIHAGDLMLYNSNCLVLFYESFYTSYSYTAIGKIDDVDGLKEAVGNGDVQITFQVKWGYYGITTVFICYE